MNESLDLYKKIFAGLLLDLKDTLNITKNEAEFCEAIKTAERIFVTGSGSSYSVAYMATRWSNSISRESNLITSSSSDILDNHSLGRGDLVILVSQGWKRADAYLVTKRCIEVGAKIVVVTGRSDRLASIYNNHRDIYPLEIRPNEEKIFCRPNSPITSYFKLIHILSLTFNLKLDSKKLLQTVKNCLSIFEKDYVVSLAKSILAADRLVILSTSLGMASAHHMALAMREGAGIQTDVHEVEAYGHGWYVTDTKSNETLHYLVFNFKKEPHNSTSVNRITPLIGGTDSRFTDINVDLDYVHGNMYVMILTAMLIIELNSTTGFDMNEPTGREENRSFHEVTDS